MNLLTINNILKLVVLCVIITRNKTHIHREYYDGYAFFKSFLNQILKTHIIFSFLFLFHNVWLKYDVVYFIITIMSKRGRRPNFLQRRGRMPQMRPRTSQSSKPKGQRTRQKRDQPGCIHSRYSSLLLWRPAQGFEEGIGCFQGDSISYQVAADEDACQV